MVHRDLVHHIQSVDFRSYIEELRGGLVETWVRGWTPHVKVHGRHVLIPTDTAVVLALVITELLTNAVKYAYGERPGPIDVSLVQSSSGSARPPWKTGRRHRHRAIQKRFGIELIRSD